MSNVLRLVEELHDSNLVKPEESPNGNTITLVEPGQGRVYQTKGGWAFLQRSLFELLGPVPGYHGRLRFPWAYGPTQSFAIVKDLKTAEIIREAMMAEVIASRMVSGIIESVKTNSHKLEN